MSNRRLALVPPRFGADVVGGAEASFRDVARGLVGRGWDVDVYTTCARDHYTWENHYPAGDVVEDGVRVRRYPVVFDTSGADRGAVEAMIARGEMPSLPEQERWMNDGLRSPELFHALLDEADGYHAVIVTPYLFWTSFAGAIVAPERTIVRPCLHDEPQASFDLFAPMLEGSARLWLNTDPERDLLGRRFPGHAPCDVVGEGITIPAAPDPEGFRARHGLGDRRFVLYAGRREGAKGWERLLDTFAATIRKGGIDLSLVTIGVGEVHLPPDLTDRVFDLGRVDDDERDNAFAAASGYLQPSALESFSRTIMEAWLAGALVIANGASDVVAWHCERSGAGLLYDDAAELEQCLRFLADAPEEAAELARSGRDYVLEHYTWDATLDRMEASLEQLR